MEGRIDIPTLIGIFFLVAGIFAGVLLVKYEKESKAKASYLVSPKSVRVTNISDASFSVTWLTDEEIEGFVKYGQEGKGLNLVSLETNSSLRRVHSVDILGLSSNTKYNFAIVSGNETFDNGGINWGIKTASSPPASTPEIISGKVLNPVETPAVGALVLASYSNSPILSSKTDSEGNWFINLTNLRDSDLTPLVIEEDSQLDISVIGNTLEIATAKATLSSSKPLPAVTLNQSYDFRNLKAEDLEPPKATFSSLPATSEIKKETNVLDTNGQ